MIYSVTLKIKIYSAALFEVLVVASRGNLIISTFAHVMKAERYNISKKKILQIMNEEFN